MPRAERLPSPVVETPPWWVVLAREEAKIFEFYLFPYNLWLAGVLLLTGKLPERDE